MTRASCGATGRCYWEIDHTIFPRRVRHDHQWQRHNKHKQKKLALQYYIVHHSEHKASKKKTQKGTSTQIIRIFIRRNHD